jgi:hypothetical protein
MPMVDTMRGALRARNHQEGYQFGNRATMITQGRAKGVQFTFIFFAMAYNRQLI